MRAYVLTTGALFGLLVVVHAWRAFQEGLGLAKDPWFLSSTLAAAALCFWSWRLLRASPRPASPDA